MRTRSPLAISLLLLACGPATAPAEPLAASAAPEPPAPSANACRATFDVLQKDAYRKEAGLSALWPPHTTTTLTLECDDADTERAVQDNHGTKPDDRDAKGKLLLTNVHAVELTGSQAELTELVSAYRSCACENAFLSLDDVKARASGRLMKEIGAYVADNLKCPKPEDKEEAAKLLAAGDARGALAIVETCSWAEGKEWAAAFNEATAKIAADAKKELRAYHVCNNDARLQVGLIADYVEHGEVRPCDVKSSGCQGPLWFYRPK